MITVFVILAIVAFICALISAVRPARLPLWIAVMLLSILELLRVLPIGK